MYVRFPHPDVTLNSSCTNARSGEQDRLADEPVAIQPYVPIPTQDPLKLYVRQIGDGPLLTHEQELDLARTDLKEEAAKAGKGAGMLGGAGVAGHFVLVFLSLALMFALGALMPLGWAALIVAVIWGIIAAVLASIGRKELKQVKGLPQTGETLSEIPPTLKPGEVNR